MRRFTYKETSEFLYAFAIYFTGLLIAGTLITAIARLAAWLSN